MAYVNVFSWTEIHRAKYIIKCFKNVIIYIYKLYFQKYTNRLIVNIFTDIFLANLFINI